MLPWLGPWVNRAIATGTDPDEAWSAAHDAFLYAYERHDRSRASFNTLVGLKFRCLLLDAHQRRIRDRSRHAPESVDDMRLAAHPDGWRRVKDALTEDAQVVANLALHPTIPMLFKAEECGGCFYSLRIAVVEALKEVGWTPERIRQALHELRRAFDA